MKKLIVLAMCIILTVSFAGCRDNSAYDSSKLQIVTTIFPLYDFARQVGGDKVQVTLLLPTGAEVHSYEPSPQDIIRIKGSDLFIHLGMEADPWTDAVINDADAQSLNVLAAMECVELHREEEHDHAHGAHALEYDQHIWTSIENAEEITEDIKEMLCRIDRENAAYYERNEERYTDKLSRLDDKFENLTQKRRGSTIVFADRFPFRYFAEEYGLKYFAAFPGCSSESEPSAATVSQLIDKVKNEKIPVVFYTETSNQQLADTVCEETGAQKMLLHSCHTVTQEELGSGMTYIDLMEKNYDSLKQALK